MGWLAKKLYGLAERRGWLAADRPGDAADVWYMGGSIVASATGLPINSDMAMRSAAVFSCVQILGKSMGTMPFKMYRRLADGGKEVAPHHPLYDLLYEQPNAWQTAFEFRQMMQSHLCLRGNAYAHIVPGRRGAVDSLEPMHPDRVKVEKLESGKLAYKVTTINGTQTMMQEEVFHLRWMPMDGIRGISPIDYMREPVGLSLAAQEYAARFFSNNATPGGVLKHPKILSELARQNMKKSWMEMQSGLQNAHTIAILEEGVEYSPISMTNEQAQFLEARKFSVTDIARIFNIPPHMVADLERATYSNIEHQSIEFVHYTLLPWCVAWEQAVNRDLVTAPQYFAEFDLDVLLRGDFKSRMDGYAVAINNGILSPNECRMREGLNRRPGGDNFYQQLNLAPSDGVTVPPPPPARTPASPGERPDRPSGRLTDRQREAIAVAVKISMDELREELISRNGNGAH